eukprot:m.26352 g.26352  ORF g.26352 m.26352 type:complete len:60 (-) comp11728_c0_seq1:113-292(-)
MHHNTYTSTRLSGVVEPRNRAPPGEDGNSCSWWCMREGAPRTCGGERDDGASLEGVQKR